MFTFTSGWPIVLTDENQHGVDSTHHLCSSTSEIQSGLWKHHSDADLWYLLSGHLKVAGICLTMIHCGSTTYLKPLGISAFKYSVITARLIFYLFLVSSCEISAMLFQHFFEV